METDRMSHYQQMDYTQWSFIQPQRKNEILSFSGKLMELENIILS
jgi:hypothetical protein